MTSSSKTRSAVLAAMAFAGGIAAFAAPVEAGHRYRHHHRGAAVAAGVAGTLALGALAVATAPVYVAGCPAVRRRVVTPSGAVYVRHERACY